MTRPSFVAQLSPLQQPQYTTSASAGSSSPAAPTMASIIARGLGKTALPPLASMEDSQHFPSLAAPGSAAAAPATAKSATDMSALAVAAPLRSTAACKPGFAEAGPACDGDVDDAIADDPLSRWKSRAAAARSRAIG